MLEFNSIIKRLDRKGNVSRSYFLSLRFPVCFREVKVMDTDITHGYRTRRVMKIMCVFRGHSHCMASPPDQDTVEDSDVSLYLISSCMMRVPRWREHHPLSLRAATLFLRDLPPPGESCWSSPESCRSSYLSECLSKSFNPSTLWWPNLSPRPYCVRPRN